MKILQISSAKSLGGGEKHLLDLSKGLTQKGHGVFIALRPNVDWKNEITFTPEANIFQVPLRNSIDVLSAWKIAQIIRQSDIEIVHAHLARDYTIAALAVRFAPQAKFVLTRHVLFPMKSLHKYVLSNLSKAIAVSSAVEKQLKTIVPAEKVVKIFNGIDTVRFQSPEREKIRREFRSENNIPLEAPFIGTIGELKPLKGQRDFILAAQIISQKFPEAHFALIGKDSSLKKDFRRELKRMVKVFNLENCFLWLDWVEDTAKALHALDVFVSPSHSESFGLAILEAMAGGTPIVATETDGAKELLAKENLVPIENPARLASEIAGLLENREESAASSKSARIRAENYFGLEKMISETEKVYLEALEKP